MNRTQQCFCAGLVIGGLGLVSPAWAETSTKDRPAQKSAQKQASHGAAQKSIQKSAETVGKPAPSAEKLLTAQADASKPPTPETASQPNQPNRQPPTGKKVTLAPFPVDIYLQPNLKPTVAFTTPCILVEKLTNGFPPVLAFEQLMFSVIGNINAADALPVRIEPVCI